MVERLAFSRWRGRARTALGSRPSWRLRHGRFLPLVPLLITASCATVGTSRIFTVPVQVERAWPVVPVAINGEQLRFIVDTAAGGTVIDGAVAERLQLPSAGEGQVAGATSSSAVRNVRASRLEIGGAVHENHQMVVTNMSQFSGNFAGILGNDVFRHYSLTVDTPGGRLTLAEADRPHLGAGMACVPNALPDRGEAMTGFPLVRVQLKASAAAAPVEVIAVIDSGAGATVLNWPAARALGLSPGDPRLIERRPLRGINPNSDGPPAYSYRLEGMTLAGWNVPATEVRVSEFPVFNALGLTDTPALIVGANILNQRAWAIARGAREFCIIPSGGAG